MNDASASSGLPRARAGALLSAVLVLAVGALALCGWAFGIPILYRVSPALPPLVPSTALLFLGSGTALALLAWMQQGVGPVKLLRSLASALGALASMFGALILFAYASGQPFALAGWLFPQAVAQLHTPFGGTPSPSTALTFVLAGASLALLGRPIAWGLSLAQWLASLVFFLGLRALIGYLIGDPSFYVVVGETGMSLITSLLFLALSCGALLLTADVGALWLLQQATATGRVFRRMMLGMGVLLVLGLVLHSLNTRAGIFGNGLTLVLLVAAGAALINWLMQALEQAERGRAAAEAEERAHAARLDSLAAASLAFAEAGNDYPALLGQIARTVTAQLGDGCSILYLSPDEQRLEPIAFYDVRPDGVALIQKLVEGLSIGVSGGGVSSGVLTSNQPVIVSLGDRGERKTFLPEDYWATCDAIGMHSLMSVPLHVYGTRVGVLTVYRYQPERPAFTPSDLALAQELGVRASLAIESAQRFDAEQRDRISAEQTSAGLERLHAVTTALSGALSVAEVSKIIMTQGVDALGADAGLVALLDPVTHDLQIIDARGYEATLLETQPRIPLAQPSALTEAVQVGVPLWISSLSQQTREFPNLLVLPLSAGFQARAALPLLSGERKIGVLQINFREGRRFEAAERTVLEALAAAGAQALDRARAYDVLQRSLQRLRTLRAIDQAMLAGQKADDIIGHALDDLHSLVPYAYGAVLLFAQGHPPQVALEREWRLLPLGEAAEPVQLAKAVEIFYGQSLRYVPAFADALPQSPSREHLASQGLHGLLTLPLDADGVRMGQLNLFTGQATTLLEEEQQIVTEIGGQIAIVLRQMQLMNERERAEERFRLVVEASPSGLVMAGTDGQIVLVNAETERMFGYLPQELVGQPVELLVPPRFRANHARFRQGFGLHPETRPMGAGRDLYGLRKDGSEFPIEIGLTPIETSQGMHILSTIVDITERKRAETALRKSEERFSQAFHASPAAMLITRQSDATFMDVNESYEDLVGYARDELIGKTGIGLDLYLNPPQRAEIVDLLRESGSLSNYELLLRTKSGELRTVLCGLESIDIDGVACYLGSLVDITERKRAETALRESEQKLSALVDLLPVGVSILNEQRQVVYSNLALEHIIDLPLGLVHEGAYRQREYIHPDGTPMRIEDFASSQALDEQRAVYGVETGIVKEDGAITWVSVNAAPVALPDWRAVVVTSDITERKRSEAALRESEERFGKAFQASPAALSISRLRDSCFVDVNERFCTLFGYERGEVVGHTLGQLDLFPDAGALAEIRSAARAQGRLRNTEIAMQTKDRRQLVILFSAELIEVNGEPCFLTLLFDVTERKLAELQLEAYTQRLRVLADASHVFAQLGTDYASLLASIVKTIASLMGDGCALRLLSDDGAWLPLRALYDSDPATAELLRKVVGEISLPADDFSMNTRVMQSGQPLLIPFVSPEQLRAATKPEFQALIERISVHSMMLVPLIIQGQSRGVVSLYRHRPEHPPFDAEDLRLMQDLTDRAALAISGAQLFQQLQAELAERSRAETALRQSEQRFATAFRANPATLIIVRRSDGMFVDANDTYKNLLGYTTEELVGHTAADLKIFADPAVRASMLRQIDTTGTVHNIESLMRTKSGELRLFLLSAEAIEIAGEPCFLVTGIDITKRKQAEDALRESEARFRQLAESLPQLVWTCQPNGQCDYLSRQWIEYTGVPEAPQLGFGWLEALHPDDRAPTIAAWEAAVASNADFTSEFRIRRYDDVYRWFDTRAVLLHDAAGLPLKWVGANTDIEERRRNQKILEQNAEQLQRLSHQLVEAQETERRYIARELHDQVGQSLTGLKLVLDSARMLAPEDLGAQLAEARSAINELLGRVRNLSLDLRPSMLDDLGLLPALRWLIDRYQAQTSINVQWWYVNIDRRFPALIETTVYRVVQEALTNVARYAKVPEVELRIMGDYDQLLVQIDDEGVGFDVETRLQSRQSVGLIGMRERIDLLGGSFLIESAPHEGTHLNITIPLPEHDAEE